MKKIIILFICLSIGQSAFGKISHFSSNHDAYTTAAGPAVHANADLYNSLYAKYPNLMQKGLVKVEGDTCLIIGPSIPKTPRFYLGALSLGLLSLSLSGVSLTCAAHAFASGDFELLSGSGLTALIAFGSAFVLRSNVKRFIDAKDSVIVKISKDSIEFPLSGEKVARSRINGLGIYSTFKPSSEVEMSTYSEDWRGNGEHGIFKAAMLEVFTKALIGALELGFNNAFDYIVAERGIGIDGRMVLLNVHMPVSRSRVLDIIHSYFEVVPE